MSHGIRTEDIAWQAWQAGARAKPFGVEASNEAFRKWWEMREQQKCALPACEKCGYDPRAIVTASWTMLVERDPTSMNARLVNAGDNRWRYKQERDAWHWELKAARLHWKVPKATGRRRVTMTRLFGGRQKEWDPDNLSGGMKPIVDALVLEGLLVGDDAASAQIYYEQVRGPVRGLKLMLEELA